MFELDGKGSLKVHGLGSLCDLLPGSCTYRAIGFKISFGRTWYRPEFLKWDLISPQLRIF